MLMSPCKLPSIACVGAGPTAIYMLLTLLRSASQPISITVFEQEGHVGKGTPYRPGWNDPAMLANIASIEIPKVIETLLQWMERQPPERLHELGINPQTLSDRTFYPRIALGAYYHDQMLGLLRLAEGAHHRVSVRTRCKVTDAAKSDGGMTLTVKPYNDHAFVESFDHVVLATGHQWPAATETQPGYFLSPYPSTALAHVPPCHIGIRGSSLSAIDAVVSLALLHGRFVQEGANLRYKPKPNTHAFKMTMMSRKGLLPEADFYFPLPYEELTYCTIDAINARLDDGPDGLLDDIFALFKRELASVDPDYAVEIDLEELCLEGFCTAYFARRMATDPFAWARANLDDASHNYAVRHTVPWRYAILRMHEAIQCVTPYLSTDDFQRFTRYFAPVFADDYATVPHESIERLLALHDCEKLDIIGLGENYRIDTHDVASGATLKTENSILHFPVFVEAMGQRALNAADFPFPTLRYQGIIRDAASEGTKGASRGISIDSQFHPLSDDMPCGQLFCLSLPYLMGRHPFIQGLTSAFEIGKVVGTQLASTISAKSSSIAFEGPFAVSAVR